MHSTHEPGGTGCHGCCGGCAGGAPDAPPPPGSPTGWSMVGWSAGVFLVPILTAAAGAALTGADRSMQAVGGVAGLLVGAGFMAIIFRLARGSGRAQGDSR